MKPTCYLLKAHIQLKLGRDGGAVLLAGLPPVPTARALAGGTAVKAHKTELDILCAGQLPVCGIYEIHRLERQIVRTGEIASVALD